MGSLVPGWAVDEPGQAPAGLEVEEESLERKARLRRDEVKDRRGDSSRTKSTVDWRSAFDGTGTDAGESSTGFRIVDRRNRSPTQAGPPSLARRSAPTPGVIRVQIPGPKGGHVLLEATPVRSPLPRRRSEELLTGQAGGNSEPGTRNLSPREQWWKNLPSSCLNDADKEVEENAHSGGTYVPQFGVGGTNPYSKGGPAA